MRFAAGADTLRTSRRDLLALGGIVGAGTLLGACGHDNKPQAHGDEQSRASDVRIVNYALTLEYLESELYRKALDTGFFVAQERELLKRFGDHEQRHLEALTAAVGKLGGRTEAEPRPNFPLTDRISILKALQRLENLGAAAYLGQLGRIRDREIRQAALSIHSVEARHAATFNTILGKDITPTGAFAQPASMEEVLPVAQLFIAA
jgi:rubrerythrin